MNGTAHDIFISYAHADDDSPDGACPGWVTTFKRWLAVALKSPLGRPPDIWMDWELAANAQVTPTLIDNVRNSRVLVLILSPLYQNSEWCQRELDNFLAEHPPHGGREAIFIVEKFPVERQFLQERLKELIPVQFWEPGPDDRVPRVLGWPEPVKDERNPYWAKVNYLANLIAAHIRNPVTMLVRESVRSGGLPDHGTAAPVVWIAEPTAKLAGYWDQLAGAIIRKGGVVRPVARDSYPLGSARVLREALDKDMEGAKLLIQLVDDEAGPRLPGSVGTLATIQHAAAKEFQQCSSGVKYLRWRPPEVDPEQVADPDLGEILFGATRSGFEPFRQMVLETLDRFKPPPPPPKGMTICLTAGERDQSLCEEVSAILEEMGWSVVSPSPTPTEADTPQTFRESVDDIIKMSNAVILLYGKESPAWIQAQYVRTSRLLAEKGVSPVLIDAPPEKKPSLNIRSRGLLALNCRNGILREEVARFIGQLGAEQHV